MRRVRRRRRWAAARAASGRVGCAAAGLAQAAAAARTAWPMLSTRSCRGGGRRGGAARRGSGDRDPVCPARGTGSAALQAQAQAQAGKQAGAWAPAGATHVGGEAKVGVGAQAAAQLLAPRGRAGHVDGRLPRAATGPGAGGILCGPCGREQGGAGGGRMSSAGSEARVGCVATGQALGWRQPSAWETPLTVLAGADVVVVAGRRLQQWRQGTTAWGGSGATAGQDVHPAARAAASALVQQRRQGWVRAGFRAPPSAQALLLRPRARLGTSVHTRLLRPGSRGHPSMVMPLRWTATTGAALRMTCNWHARRNWRTSASRPLLCVKDSTQARPEVTHAARSARMVMERMFADCEGCATNAEPPICASFTHLNPRVEHPGATPSRHRLFRNELALLLQHTLENEKQAPWRAGEG